MLQDRVEQYRRIEAERKSKVLVFITGDKPGMETQISPEVHNHFVNHLDKMNLPERVSLYLYTRGGDTMAAWGLINLIQQFCNEYEVIVPSIARSAGTLMCLGASNIIMTKQATLGPIDPSLNGALNPANPAFPQNPQARVPVSVESIKGFFDYAKQELGIKNEGDLTKIFNDLTQHVHPLVIGDVFRTRSQIQMLAKNLLSKHIEDTDKREKIISFLCSDSGSHDYPIYRREARDLLGLKIETPSMEFYQIIKAVFDSISVELGFKDKWDPNVLLGNKSNTAYSVRRVLIESIEGGTDVFLSEGNLTKNQVQMPMHPGMPPITRHAIEDQRSFEGWRHEDFAA